MEFCPHRVNGVLLDITQTHEAKGASGFFLKVCNEVFVEALGLSAARKFQPQISPRWRYARPSRYRLATEKPYEYKGGAGIGKK
jgi:hypothetical protein